MVIELIAQIIAGIIVGVASGLITLYIFYLYLLPGLTRNMTSNLLKQLKEDPEYKPVITKAVEIVNRLEPLMQEFKGLNLNGIQKDIQPIIRIAKNIDPEKVDEILKSIKEILDKTVKQPKIPLP